MATTSDRQLGTIVLVLLAAVVVLPTLFMGFGMMGGGPMYGGPMMGGWGQGSGGAAYPTWVVVGGFVVQLLFLAAIIGAGYLIFRALTRRGGGRDPAIDELRRAYARGDLTDEEFESRRNVLEGDD